MSREAELLKVSEDESVNAPAVVMNGIRVESRLETVSAVVEAVEVAMRCVTVSVPPTEPEPSSLKLILASRRSASKLPATSTFPAKVDVPVPEMISPPVTVRLLSIVAERPTVTPPANVEVAVDEVA